MKEEDDRGKLRGDKYPHDRDGGTIDGTKPVPGGLFYEPEPDVNFDWFPK